MSKTESKGETWVKDDPGLIQESFRESRTTEENNKNKQNNPTAITHNCKVGASSLGESTWSTGFVGCEFRYTVKV